MTDQLRANFPPAPEPAGEAEERCEYRMGASIEGEPILCGLPRVVPWEHAWTPHVGPLGHRFVPPAPAPSDETAHRMMIRRVAVPGHEAWQGYCLCGWSGDIRSAAMFADGDAEAHVLNPPVAEETAGLDEARSIFRPTPYADKLAMQAVPDAIREAIAAEARAPLQARLDEARANVRRLLAAGEVDGRTALIARAEAAEAERDQMAEALRRIATDPDGLACSDIPHCTGHPHASDCAVGIAERALAATSQGGEGKGE